jgi:hypothetical protein
MTQLPCGRPSHLRSASRIRLFYQSSPAAKRKVFLVEVSSNHSIYLEFINLRNQIESYASAITGDNTFKQIVIPEIIPDYVRLFIEDFHYLIYQNLNLYLSSKLK